jgi:hypothetical protein
MSSDRLRSAWLVAEHPNNDLAVGFDCSRPVGEALNTSQLLMVGWIF